MTSALALFGTGSWLDTAVNYVSKMSFNITAEDTGTSGNSSWQLLCRGMPFAKLGGLPLHDSVASDSDVESLCRRLDQRMLYGYTAHEEDVLLATQRFLAAFAPSIDVTSDSQEKTLDNAEGLLAVSMFVSNRALLTLYSPEAGSYDTPIGTIWRFIYASPGVALQKPILSKRALIVLSVLIGLQLLGLTYLAYYLYRVPTWSDQLDAMAMARIGASLHDRDVLPAIGPVSKEDLTALQTVGALVGIVEKSARRKNSIPRSESPEIAVTGDSGVELQMLGSAEGGRESTMTRYVAPDLASANDSDVESQRLESAEEGYEHFEDGRPGAISPNLATTDSPDAELQRLNSTEELRGSLEDLRTSLELGLDAPGPILATNSERRSQYLRGVKRVWMSYLATTSP